ncbi:MAG TPA: serine hydrolase domain-containing protein [Steroidobacteraceae bacterium]|jgi:CubicO group peptidase (beta-lactamase class C family)
MRKAIQLLLLAALAAAPAAWCDPSIDHAKIDAALSGFIDSKALVGVSALIYQDGHEAYYGAFGQADREAGRPMKRDTLVQIFSMTKPITGVAFMSLFEQGKFQLDEPLAKYAPEFANLKVYGGVDPQGNAILLPLNRPVTLRSPVTPWASTTARTKHRSPSSRTRRMPPTSATA